MEHNLDFEIYTRGNPELLILIDTSEVFEYPSNSIVEVTFPSSDKIYKDYYNVDKPTTLTTKSLGYSPNRIDFPDGLYSLRISVAPNKDVFKCKNYMKTDILSNKIADLLTGCLSNTELLEYMELDKYLTSAKLLENKDAQKSIELYQLASNKLKKISCYV